MTHITEERVIGNHAAMGGSTPAAPDTPLTVAEIPCGSTPRRQTQRNTCGTVDLGFRRRGNRTR